MADARAIDVVSSFFYFEAHFFLLYFFAFFFFFLRLFCFCAAMPAKIDLGRVSFDSRFPFLSLHFQLGTSVERLSVGKGSAGMTNGEGGYSQPGHTSEHQQQQQRQHAVSRAPPPTQYPGLPPYMPQYHQQQYQTQQALQQPYHQQYQQQQQYQQAQQYTAAGGPAQAQAPAAPGQARLVGVYQAGLLRSNSAVG
jgi:hypothetical protein